MKLNHFYDEKTGSVKVFRIILYVVLIAVFIGTISWGIGIISLPFRQGKELAEQVTSAEHVKYNYEWFYEQYHAIQATENKIKTLLGRKESLDKQLPEDSEDWSFQQKEKFSNLEEALTGTINRYYDQVSKYNARSRELTRNIFKGRDLPKRLTPKEWR